MESEQNEVHFRDITYEKFLILIDIIRFNNILFITLKLEP
jgi:hypothetical protein